MSEIIVDLGKAEIIQASPKPTQGEKDMSGSHAFSGVRTLTLEEINQLNIRHVHVQMGAYIIKAQEVRQTPYMFPVSHLTASFGQSTIKLFNLNDVISEQEQADGWELNVALFSVDGIQGAQVYQDAHTNDIVLNLPQNAVGGFAITHPHFDGRLTGFIPLPV